jgi:hypothetical protein
MMIAVPSLVGTPVATQLVLKVPGASRRSIDRCHRQVGIAWVSDMEEVAIDIAVRVATSLSARPLAVSNVPMRLCLHEEVAKASRVRPGRADFVVEIRTKWNTCTAWSSDVLAVAAEAAVVAKVDSCVGALLNFGHGSSKGDTCDESGESDRKLHVDGRKFCLGKT